MSVEELADYLADDTYAYVEDTYLPADDLAEHAVPSPPAYESDEEFDFDLWQYDYWADIDYGSDGDEIRDRQQISRAVRAKKRQLLAATQPRSKKRKVPSPVSRKASGQSRTAEDLPPVAILKNAVSARYEPQETRFVADVAELRSWALLEDWRDRFRNAPMWDRKTSSAHLPQVQDAADDDGPADGDDVEADQTAASADISGIEEDEDGWEDQDEENGHMELDSAAIRMALKAKLAASGIGGQGMDEEMLMKMAMQMLQGDGDGDDLAGDLAAQLLGGRPADEDDQDDEDTFSQTTEAGVETNDFAKWVKGQAEANVKSKKEQARDNELPTPTDSVGTPSASPVEMKTVAKGKGLDATIPLQTSKSQDFQTESQGKKRKADSADSNAQPRKVATGKRRFDAPTASSRAKALGKGRIL